MLTHWETHITFTPGILGGKAIVKGTRIGVDIVLEKLSVGDSIEQVLQAYPHLSREAILACLAYATSAVRNDTVYQVG